MSVGMGCILMVRRSPWQQDAGGAGWMSWGRGVEGREENRKERSCSKERLMIEGKKKSVPECMYSTSTRNGEEGARGTSLHLRDKPRALYHSPNLFCLVGTAVARGVRPVKFIFHHWGSPTAQDPFHPSCTPAACWIWSSGVKLTANELLSWGSRLDAWHR